MIEPSDYEQLKEVFVTRQECRNTEDQMNEKMNIISQDVTMVKTKLNIIIAILGTIGACMVSIALNGYFG